MIRAMLAAAFVAGAATAAPAAVLPKTDPGASASNLVEVQYRDHRDHRRHWVPGRRYDAPPPRWRRYHARPHDWRRRGCVIVGPLWFCP